MNVNQLMCVAGVGLAACIGISSLFGNEVSDKILNSNVCREVLTEVRNHKGAVHFLGEPIEASSARFGGYGVIFTGETSLRLNVSGPKSKGIVFSTIKKDEQEGPKLCSIQLQIGSDASKRLVIKN